MAIKFHYPPIVLKKMQRYLDRCLELHPAIRDERYKNSERNTNWRAQANYITERCGMGIGYLKGCILGHNLDPSGRVLKNMGFEVYLKDLETGEFEKIDYHGRCEIDHSDPLNPKLMLEEAE
jgi:hypothetical protein